MTRDSASGSKSPPLPPASYEELHRIVRAAGLLRPQTKYYTTRIATNLVGLGLGAFIFLKLANSWWQLMTASYLAIVLAQIAMIGHDTGHRQISRSRHVNAVLGYTHHNLLTGVSFGWWVQRHSRHHAHPNDPDRDPDLKNRIVVLSHEQLASRSKFTRSMVKYQAFYFLPLLFLAQGVALHVVHTYRLIVSVRQRRSLELSLLIVHFTCYGWIVFATLSPLRALSFVLLNQGLFGAYITGTVAPNHKGMPTLGSGHQVSYIERQVLPSRNIRGGALLERAFGGLNYQIEHHLFPTMPARSLRRAKPIVESYCYEHGIPYTEVGMFDSYRQVLSHLSDVTRIPNRSR